MGRSGLGNRSLWPGQSLARLALDRPVLGRNLAVGFPLDFAETSFGQAAWPGRAARAVAVDNHALRALLHRAGIYPLRALGTSRFLVCVGARGSVAHRYGHFGTDL